MNNKIEILSAPEKVDMADDWYEFVSVQHFWIKARFNAVKRNPIINNLSNVKLFEIGCGNGLIIRQFESLPGVTVDGCDLNMFALNQIEYTNGRLFCLNIFEKPEALINQYDGILLMDIIEHIPDDNEFLKVSTEYLKNGGLVIINVPALNFLYSKYDRLVGHKRRYTKKMIDDLFAQNQIEKVSIEYWGGSLLIVVLVRKIIIPFISKSKIVQYGIAPPNDKVNCLFDKILKLENRIFRSSILGTSIIAVGKLRK